MKLRKEKGVFLFSFMLQNIKITLKHTVAVQRSKTLSCVALLQCVWSKVIRPNYLLLRCAAQLCFRLKSSNDKDLFATLNRVTDTGISKNFYILKRRVDKWSFETHFKKSDGDMLVYFQSQKMQPFIEIPTLRESM